MAKEEFHYYKVKHHTGDTYYKHAPGLYAVKVVPGQQRISVLKNISFHGQVAMDKLGKMTNTVSRGPIKIYTPTTEKLFNYHLQRTIESINQL